LDNLQVIYGAIVFFLFISGYLLSNNMTLIFIRELEVHV